MPSSFLSRTSSAMSSTSSRLLTWYGSSVTTICDLFERLLLLDHRARAHDDAAAARLLVVLDAGAAVDEAARREVRALDELAQLADRRASGLSISAMIAAMTSRRLCGGMFVAMPTAMPDEPLTSRFGNAAGRTFGSCRRSSKLGAKSTVFLSMSASSSIAIAREPRFGVPIRRRGVAVDRAEVPLAVDQRIAQREVLHHAHERVVDRRVAVRVVLAEHVADDRRALLVRAARHQAELVHRVQHAPVHRLESVAHVGQRARHDDAHRVVDERLFDLVVDEAREDPFALIWSGHDVGR